MRWDDLREIRYKFVNPFNSITNLKYMGLKF